VSGATSSDTRVEKSARGRTGAPCPSSLDAPVASATRASWWSVAGAGAVAIHCAVVLSVARLGSAGQRVEQVPVPVTQMVEVELPPPPEPKPEPEPEPVEQAPEPEVVPPPPVKPAPRPRAVKPPPPPPEPKPAPPPAAAEAGKVLEAKEPAAASDSVVTGEAQQHAGGTTESGGTSKQAVRDLSARAAGVPGGTGTDVDQSRQPQLAGGAQWDCPFPMEADDEGIDHAVVTLRVEVAADGGVSKVEATNDPGYGFAREARRCASRKRWAPGFNREGQPASAVALVRVRFDR